MTTFVLVPGAWSGAYYLKPVASLLQAAGHAVYRCTLTGLGERTHLLNRSVNLETHVLDVANLIRCEGLEGVILVGHSYGGTVITGVAERVPERLAHLVYLDAIVPEDGESDLGPVGAYARSVVELSARERGDGWLSPGKGEPDRVTLRHGPHPLACFTQPLSLKSSAAKALPRTYIYCTADKEPSSFIEDAVRLSAQRGRGPGWHYVEIDAGHDAPEAAPELVAGVLLGVG
jgi:pimeloyl-ACP methyl ester carboxylesterase